MQGLESRLPPELAAASTWLLNTEEDKRRLPSCLDGLTYEQEAHERACAVFAIRAVARILKLHDLTAATASLYLHRFYMKVSFTSYAWRDMVPAALFLATKVEEELRRIREIVGAYLAWTHACEPQKDSEERWKQVTRSVLYHEEILLDILCYDLSVEHPYTFVLRGAPLLYEPRSRNILGDDDEEGETDRPDEAHTDRIDKLRRAAWTVVSDSFATNLCIHYEPRQIAAMALLVGSRILRDPLPMQNGTQGRNIPKAMGERTVKKEWWDMFGITKEALEAGVAIIVARYALSRNEHIQIEAKKLASFGNQALPNVPGTPPLPPALPTKIHSLPEKVSGSRQEDKSTILAVGVSGPDSILGLLAPTAPHGDATFQHLDDEMSRLNGTHGENAPPADLGESYSALQGAIPQTARTEEDRGRDVLWMYI